MGRPPYLFPHSDNLHRAIQLQNLPQHDQRDNDSPRGWKKNPGSRHSRPPWTFRPVGRSSPRPLPSAWQQPVNALEELSARGFPQYRRNATRFKAQAAGGRLFPPSRGNNPVQTFPSRKEMPSGQRKIGKKKGFPSHKERATRERASFPLETTKDESWQSQPTTGLIGN
jgi:hypothetical protein